MRLTYASFLLGYVLNDHIVSDKLYKKILGKVTEYIETLDPRYYFTCYGLLCFLEKLQLELDIEECDNVTLALQEKRYEQLIKSFAEHGVILGKKSN